jgi:hypothetical protein
VVTSDDPALVEVGGGATLATPIGDATALAAGIVRALGDTELRRRLVGAGLDRAGSLTWTATARRMWQVYAQAAE